MVQEGDWLNCLRRLVQQGVQELERRYPQQKNLLKDPQEEEEDRGDMHQVFRICQV